MSGIANIRAQMERLRTLFPALDDGFMPYTGVLLGCTDADGSVFAVEEQADSQRTGLFLLPRPEGTE